MRSSTAPSEAWARWGREEEDIPLTEEWTKATQIFTEDKKDMLLFMVRLLDCFRALSVGEIDDVGDLEESAEEVRAGKGCSRFGKLCWRPPAASKRGIEPLCCLRWRPSVRWRRCST